LCAQARQATATSAVALPMWEQWLPKMRAGAKEALGPHPLLGAGVLPHDECTQYALIECVWLFDKAQTPWLVGTHPTPSLYPVSGVDRHIKESLMKDLYTALIAPVIEEATPENGSFVPL